MQTPPGYPGYPSLASVLRSDRTGLIEPPGGSYSYGPMEPQTRLGPGTLPASSALQQFLFEAIQQVERGLGAKGQAHAHSLIDHHGIWDSWAVPVTMSRSSKTPTVFLVPLEESGTLPFLLFMHVSLLDWTTHINRFVYEYKHVPKYSLAGNRMADVRVQSPNATGLATIEDEAGLAPTPLKIFHGVEITPAVLAACRCAKALARTGKLA